MKTNFLAHKKIFLPVLLVLVFANGCKKEFLDRKPLGQLTFDTFFQNEEQAIQATNAVYNQYRSFDCAALALLAGCALGPDYQRPNLVMPATYREEAALPGQDVPAEWWTLYNDATLNKLVADVLKNTADTRIAAAQVGGGQSLLAVCAAIQRARLSSSPIHARRLS